MLTFPNPFDGSSNYDVLQKQIHIFATYYTALAPVADFTATPLSGIYPLTVQFTDTSTNTPTSWLWSFGDGNASSLQSPSHQYTRPGVYTVSLTATNAAGSDTETKVGYVTVLKKKVCSFIYQVISRIKRVFLLNAPDGVIGKDDKYQIAVGVSMK